MTFEFRSLTTADELAPLPVFERRIWGSASDLVSVNVLVATISEGGMAIGAFDGGELVGVVYGFATRDPEVLHSHYLAVEPALRRSGLGAELKRRQRDWCLARGITGMRWTFDPLQLTNAHLNLGTLGAVGVSYHEDLYGTLGGINGDLPTDRLTVHWDLAGAPRRWQHHDTIVVPPATPEDIAASNPAARHARLWLREQMAPRLAGDWRVTGIDRDTRRYTLSR